MKNLYNKTNEAAYVQGLARAFEKLDKDGVAWFKKRHTDTCPGKKKCTGCFKPFTMLHKILKQKKKLAKFL